MALPSLDDEMALFGEQKRSADVYADRTSELLVLRIDADRPPGLFDTKTVRCTLAGVRIPRRLAPNGELDPADYQVTFEAAGVARDLVHPVADAVAELVDGYFTRVAANAP